MIIAKNLTKRYGEITALDAVSFDITDGESVALWGANGAGKTTTLRCLLGVYGFEGDLTINDIVVRKRGKAARSVIGYVPQETTFYDMTVDETTEFYARLKKVDAERVDAVLEQVQLTPHRHKRVGMLSGGMKQRLALAVALLADPPLLVLDEPTANLDVQAQREFIHTIRTLNQAGKTIVFSSHRLEEVLALATRVLVLRDGRLALDCAPHEMAEKLGLHRWLQIWVPKNQHDNTLKILDQKGYTCLANGRSVYVQITTDGKIAPLRTLELANISVEDFDLIDGELLSTGDSYE